MSDKPGLSRRQLLKVMVLVGLPASLIPSVSRAGVMDASEAAIVAETSEDPAPSELFGPPGTTSSTTTTTTKATTTSTTTTSTTTTTTTTTPVPVELFKFSIE